MQATDLSSKINIAVLLSLLTEDL